MISILTIVILLFPPLVAYIIIELFKHVIPTSYVTNNSIISL